MQKGVEGSGERVGLVLGRKVVGQRLKSMKIQSVMVVSSGGEASEGGGVVVVRESEVVERTRERWVIMGCDYGVEVERRRRMVVVVVVVVGEEELGVKERAMMVE